MSETTSLLALVMKAGARQIDAQWKSLHVFPYEWLDNYDKLIHDRLIVYEAFYCSLKLQMKCFVLLLNLKEHQKSGRSPFTVS